MKPLACLVGQHTDLLAFEPPRLFLRCLDCGRETPGIVSGREPVAPDVSAPASSFSYPSSLGFPGLPVRR